MNFDSIFSGRSFPGKSFAGNLFSGRSGADFLLSDFCKKSYDKFGFLFEESCPGFFRNAVSESHIRMTAPVYLSCILNAGFIYFMIAVAWSFAIAIFTSVFPSILPFNFSSVLLFNFSSVFASVIQIFIISFTTAFSFLFLFPGFFLLIGSISLPYFLISERRRAIDRSLSDCASYFFALSVAGISPENICDFMCSAETSGFFDEIRSEFIDIRKAGRFFGKDFSTAVRERSEKTVSKDFSEFLSGFASVVDSGGDLSSYLNEKKRECRERSKNKQHQKMQRADLFAETASIVFLGAPMFFLILLYLMAPLSGNQDAMISMLTYAIIPGLGVVFLIAADSGE